MQQSLNAKLKSSSSGIDQWKRKPAMYIAGPMRGYPRYNYPAFFEAEDNLKKRFPWLVIINPARLEACCGVDESEPGVPTREALRSFIRRDLLAIIDQCDSMYMLKGWERSAGARAEHSLAVFLNLRITYEE